MQANGRVARGYGDVKYLSSFPSVVSLCGGRDRQHQEPITTGLQLRHIPVFKDRSIFSLNYLEFRSPLEPQRPLFYSYRSVLMLTLELAYFAGKIYKNRLVRKNAMALAYYGSCKFLVMTPNSTSDLHCDRTGLTLLSDVLPRKLFRLCGLCST